MENIQGLQTINNQQIPNQLQKRLSLTENQLTSSQTQTNGNHPLKVIFLFAALGLTSYFLVKLSRAIVTELEK